MFLLILCFPSHFWYNKPSYLAPDFLATILILKHKLVPFSEPRLSYNVSFPGGASDKEPALPMQVDWRDVGSISGSGRSSGGGHGNPPQYSCLENPVISSKSLNSVHVFSVPLTHWSKFPRFFKGSSYLWVITLNSNAIWNIWHFRKMA